MIHNIAAIVVMGVSGAGKTTIAQALAKRLEFRFEDGDAFHPQSNVVKMASGTPLTDEDRKPWLEAIANEIDRKAKSGQAIVVACSALKRAYRDILVHGRDDVRIVYLKGNHDVIAERLKHRSGHFMPPSLLDSQFETIEEPTPAENAITVNIDAPFCRTVNDIVEKL
jgi:gluconokinase